MNRKSFIFMAAAQAAEAAKPAATGGQPPKAETQPAATIASTASAPAAAAAATPQAAQLATPAAGTATTTEAPAAGTVPTSNDPALVAAAEQRKRAPKDPANQLNIINGRLPLPLVFLIRTKEAGKPTGDVAKRYGTSIGKVFDIFKGRNFGYVTADYKPSKEEMDAAQAWISTSKTTKGQTLKEAGGDPDGIATLLKTLTVASSEEVAKRNWTVRQIGQPAAANQAPSAPAGTATPTATTTTVAEKPAGAKMF